MLSYAEPRPRIKGYIVFIIATLSLSAALLFVSRRVEGFAEWYARKIFPFFPSVIGRLTSRAPFSLIEFLVIGSLVSIPLYVMWKVLYGIHRRRFIYEAPKKSFSQKFLGVCCAICAYILLVVLTCGINFSRQTFAEQAGLVIGEASVGDLRQLYRFLIDQINESPPDFSDMDNRKLNDIAKKTMEELSVAYPGFINYYPDVKAVYFSEALSYCQLAGFYSSLTMEANYNKSMPGTNIPFTICHELAHLSGFAREDEANFIGYLACGISGDPYFRYSGLSYALRYTLSALKGSIEDEEYIALCEYLPEWSWREINENKQYWASFEGKTSELSNIVNDSFLKLNNQEDGTRSYGRMLYLLLAHYREQGRLERYSANPEPKLAELSAPEDGLHSPYAILIDRETGITLFAKDSEARAEPASVTKILTAVTAIELIEDLDARVTMKNQDFTDLYKKNASLSGFKTGESVSYRDLLYTLMMISGCDSAYALANNLCGSVSAFADKMNERVKKLGLNNSHFVDPSGLTAEGHYSSAADTAKILDYALRNPVFKEIFEARSYTVSPTNVSAEGREINSTFFSRIERDYDSGRLENGSLLTGGKTGFTNAAGLCLATVGKFDSREYIVVIFGGPGTNRTAQYNFMDAVTLFSALKHRRYTRQAF